MWVSLLTAGAASAQVQMYSQPVDNSAELLG